MKNSILFLPNMIKEDLNYIKQNYNFNIFKQIATLLKRFMVKKLSSVKNGWNSKAKK